MLGELVCGLGGVDLVQDDISPSTVVASPIYRGPDPLPKY